MNNIWQVTTTKDLIELMNKCANKFAIIGITLKNTSKEQKKIIKNFFKTKYLQYPNIYFIYYEIKDSELGKGTNLLKNSPEEYPYLYHIYDIDKILVNVSNVNEETINESFNVIKHYYDNNKNNIQPLARSAESLQEYDNELRNKISIIKNKSEEYSINILKDIKNRKKREIE